MTLYNKYRNYNPTNLETFCTLLREENWPSVYMEHDAELSYNNFFKTFVYYFKGGVMQTEKKKNDWIIHEIRSLKEEVMTMHSLCKRYPTEANTSAYKNLQKIYQLRLIKARKDHFNNTIQNSENKSKTIWQMINSELDETEYKRKIMI
ncbi:hypothetical protein HHI36_006017 [Cryptolaemus montrouzieri]|uniref:Uncharacterized protein n=1 Tax=Cryptolaemus montrouzieri TaxID=559131 RepID=A0ABD2NVV5_9CUCU